MAWIETVTEGDAEGWLRDLYDEVRDPSSGLLDNIMSIHALHPAGLRAHYDLYRAVMTGTPGLRKVDRELIAFVVSDENECHY